MRQFTKGITVIVTGNPNSLLLGKIRLYIFHPQKNWDVECGIKPCFTQTNTECVHVTNPILLTTCRDTNRAFRYNTFCLRKFNRGNNQDDEHVNITFHFRKQFGQVLLFQYACIICIVKQQCIAYITKSTFVLCVSHLSI